MAPSFGLCGIVARGGQANREKFEMNSSLLPIAQVKRAVAVAAARRQCYPVLRPEIPLEHLRWFFAGFDLILFIHIVNNNLIARRMTSSWFVPSHIDLMIRWLVAAENLGAHPHHSPLEGESVSLGRKPVSEPVGGL